MLTSGKPTLIPLTPTLSVTMDARIQTFVNEHIVVNPNAQVSVAMVNARYFSFNHGSTTGKIKLHGVIKSIEGVLKVGTSFTGIELTPEVVTVTQSQVPAPMTEYERKSLELQARDQEESRKLEVLKLEETRKLEVLKLELEEAHKLEARKLEDRKLESTERIESNKIANKLQMQKNDHEFFQIENNKNRKMYSRKHHNKYLDFELYGTPSSQIVTCDSFARNVMFSIYCSTNDVKYFPKVQELVNNVHETVPVVENNKVVNKPAVHISKAQGLLDEINSFLNTSKVSNVDFSSIKERISVIPEIAIHDDVEKRFIPSTYCKKLAAQDVYKFERYQLAHCYLRPENRAEKFYNNSRLDNKVSCFCCGYRGILSSNEFQRGHNIPKSKGGDWSNSNIYIICNTCNNVMSNKYTVEEYKAMLLDKALSKLKK